MTPKQLHAGRIKALRAALQERKSEVALLTSLPNIRYFSGFTGSNGLLLVTGTGVTLYTDPRYTLQARQQTGLPVVTVRGPLDPAAAKRLASTKGRVALAFENRRITYAAFTRLRQALPDRVSFVNLDDACERIRAVKSAEEIARIRESVQINSAAFEKTIQAFRPGTTELALAAELEYAQRKGGAEGPAFESIVAFGPGSALIHGRPSERKIDGRGLLLIDMGSLRGGYASDMTRTVHLSRPSAKTRQMYDAVLEAQLAAIAAVAPGVSTRKVDAAARKVLRAYGMDQLFTHSTGHGLGLEIHEFPSLAQKKSAESRLEAGMAITIEPGAYLEDFGGVRIEDTVLVTPTGCEVLTQTPKDFLVL